MRVGRGRLMLPHRPSWTSGGGGTRRLPPSRIEGREQGATLDPEERQDEEGGIGHSRAPVETQCRSGGRWVSLAIALRNAPG
jgi:hypothetical protein